MKKKKVTLRHQGQVVLPAEVCAALNLDDGSELVVSVEDGRIILEALPTSEDWAELFKATPREQVTIDEHGHYDPKKAPKFHTWMTEERHDD